MSNPRRRRQAGSLASIAVHELRDAFASLSVRAIARRYGVDPHTVHYWRKKLGIRVRLDPGEEESSDG